MNKQPSLFVHPDVRRSQVHSTWWQTSLSVCIVLQHVFVLQPLYCPDAVISVVIKTNISKWFILFKPSSSGKPSLSPCFMTGVKHNRDTRSWIVSTAWIAYLHSVNSTQDQRDGSLQFQSAKCFDKKYRQTHILENIYLPFVSILKHFYKHFTESQSLRFQLFNFAHRFYSPASGLKAHFKNVDIWAQWISQPNGFFRGWNQRWEPWVYIKKGCRM